MLPSRLKIGDLFNPRIMFPLLGSTAIPYALLKNPNLSDPIKILSGVILTYSDENGICPLPKREDLAEKMGWKLRKLDRQISTMKKYGVEFYYMEFTNNLMTTVLELLKLVEV